MIKKEEGFSGQRTCMLSPAVLEAVANHPLCQQLYITDFGCSPKSALHPCRRKKSCGQHLLIYCVQGEGWYQVHGKRYQVRAHQVFLLPDSVPHEYGSDPQKPWTIYWLHFSGDHAGLFLNYLSHQHQFLALDLPADRRRTALFEDISHHLALSENLDNLLYANSCFYHFLVTLKSSVSRQSAGVAKQEADAVELAIGFMKAHLDRNLSLQDLAGQAGMSASHFSALFKKKTRKSPVNFFTGLRMQKACELLENSRLKVKDIAHQVGFHDPYHFTRVFTQATGYAPKKFRTLEKA